MEHGRPRLGGTTSHHEPIPGTDRSKGPASWSTREVHGQSVACCGAARANAGRATPGRQLPDFWPADGPLPVHGDPAGEGATKTAKSSSSAAGYGAPAPPGSASRPPRCPVVDRYPAWQRSTVSDRPRFRFQFIENECRLLPLFLFGAPSASPRRPRTRNTSGHLSWRRRGRARRLTATASSSLRACGVSVLPRGYPACTDLGDQAQGNSRRNSDDGGFIIGRFGPRPKRSGEPQFQVLSESLY